MQKIVLHKDNASTDRHTSQSLFAYPNKNIEREIGVHYHSIST